MLAPFFDISLIWPPAGLSLAALYALGLRFWPGVFLGAIAFTLSTWTSPWAAIFIASGSTLGALLGAYLLRKWLGPDVLFDSVRNAVLFIFLGAAVSAIPPALTGTLSLSIWQDESYPSAFVLFFNWWLGDVTGILLITPLLVGLVKTNRMTTGARYWLEYGVGLLLLATATLSLMTGPLFYEMRDSLAAFMLLPVIVWLTVRFSVTGGLFAVVVMTGLSIYALHPEPLQKEVVILQWLVSVASITVILLGSSIRERRNVELELRKSRDSLEDVVDKRTQQLMAVNHKLAERQRMLNDAQRLTKLGNWSFDLANGDLHWSDEVFRILNLEPTINTPTFDEFLEYVCPDDRDAVRHAIERCIRDKKSFVLEHRLKLHRDICKTVEDRGDVILDPITGKEYVIGILRDITEQQSMKHALAVSQAQWDYAMDFFEEGLCLVDPTGTVLRANKSFYRMTRLSAKEVVGVALNALMHPNLDPSDCPICQARRNKQDALVILEVSHPANPFNYPIEASLRRVSTTPKSDNFTLLVSIKDLSKKRLESERYRAVFNGAVNPMCLVREGAIVELNSAMVAMFARSYDSLIGIKFSGLSIEGKSSASNYEYLLETSIYRAEAGEVVSFSWEFHVRECGTFYTDVTISRIPGIDPVTLLIVIRDTTEHTKYERALTESQNKLAYAQKIAKIGYWDWYVESGRMSWSDETYTIFGISQQKHDVKFKDFIDLVHAEDRNQVIAAIYHRGLTTGDTGTFQYRIRTPTNEERYLQSKAQLDSPDSEGSKVVGVVQDITDSVRHEALLRESERQFRAAADSSPNGLMIICEGVIVYVNDTMEGISGYQKSDLIGKPIEVLTHQYSRKDLAKDILGNAGNAVRPERKVFLQSKAGERVIANIVYRPITTKEKPAVLLTITDITDSVWADYSQQIRSDLLLDIANAPPTSEAQVKNKVLHVLGEVAKSMDVDRISLWRPEHNEASLALDIVALKDAAGSYRRVDVGGPVFREGGLYLDEVYSGKVVSATYAQEDPRTRGLRDVYYHPNGIQSVLDTALQWKNEVVYIASFEALNTARVWSKAEIYFVCETLRNISVIYSSYSDYKRHKEVRYLAEHDALTGLRNRREYEQRLTQAIGLLDGSIQHSVLFMDLDNFKIINDSCGHNAGDEVLKQVAGILRAHARSGDIVARMGGDEFCALLYNCSAEDALAVAKEIRNEISAFRFNWNGKIFTVGISIGVVSVSQSDIPVETVLSCADTASYLAKDLGTNQIKVASLDDVEISLRKAQTEWLVKIEEALRSDQFILRRQPIVALDSSTGGPAHFEILLAIKQEDGTLIYPDAFIPSAERYKMMPQVDRWVIRSVIEWMSEISGSSEDLDRYSINLSGQSFGEEGFLDFVLNTIDRSGIDPTRIIFEITETSAIVNLARTTQFIHVLRGRGCKFALDDFGSGLSSFGYLKSLSLDYLKIDGKFVKDMDTNAIDFATVEAIHKIGSVLGLKTIAEFVETEAVVDKLREIGIHYAQGHLFGKPSIFTE